MKRIPYWLDYPDRPTFLSSNPLPSEVDVVVVGAGFTGLSCAYHLAKAGTDVAVLDAGRVGAMASGQNGGQLNNGLAGSYTAAKKKYGQKLATSFYQCYEKSVDLIERIVREENIDCSFKRTGKLKVAVKPAHFDSIKAQHAVMFKEVDPDLEVLGPSDVRKEVATDQYFGGLLYKKSAQVHMGRYSEGLAQAVLRHGGQIWENTPVTGISPKGQKYLVETSTGSVLAQEVILATGVSRANPFSWFKRRIIPVGSYIVVTEPLNEATLDDLLPNRLNVTTSANIGNYFRVLPDNRLLYGGRAKFSAYTGKDDNSAGEILRSSLRQVFPQLSHVRLDYCWGGAVDMTADRLPHTGTYRGMSYAMGYSGHGAQLSTYLGRHLARRALGLNDHVPFQDLKWPPIPGYSGWPWFLPFVGAYYRYKDWTS